MVSVTFLEIGKTVQVEAGSTLLAAEIAAGLSPDAPCGGHGRCGKCRVLVDGTARLACQTAVTNDVAVSLPRNTATDICIDAKVSAVSPDGADPYVLAFDIGTTTVVCYLLDGHNGTLLAQAGMENPQRAYGADVISRIQYVMETGSTALRGEILHALAHLARVTAVQAGIKPDTITLASIVGNTAMHHLLLGLDPRPLTVPPYMPAQSCALDLPSRGLLPIAENGTVRILPNIAGFVGGDTVACMAATEFDKLEAITLLLDIGTNGEMVLGTRRRRIACSAAAGPAFEGAAISCGMRSEAGAIDRVWLEGDAVQFHAIGDCIPRGLCGSGLLDLVSVLLECGVLDESGRLLCGSGYRLPGTEVVLTQRDVREVQLAKAAIRTGIELMAQTLGIAIPQITSVLLAGAFGSRLSPGSACKIGMIPPCLCDRIQPIGNAAGTGAIRCALSGAEFARSSVLAEETEFLELASLPQFQDAFVDALLFSEDE